MQRVAEVGGAVQSARFWLRAYWVRVLAWVALCVGARGWKVGA
jgi:hypothetical protein